MTLHDALLARLLDDLSRAVLDESRRFINYRDLSVQQLGGIYERLLERDVIADGPSVAVANNAVARHRAGSFFTTEKLVQLILAQAIGPLLDEARGRFRAKLDKLADDRRRPAEKLADLRRDDPAEAFVSLRVCDPAMGSGHFLVALVDKLAVETLAAMAEASAAVTWAPYRSPLAERIDAIREHISSEAVRHGWEVREEHLDDKALLRRIILKRCVYGVDSNPLAVELAKLALWLHCFTVGAPLSFLDHHLRTGDSLLGERVGDVLREIAERGPLATPLGVQNALGASRGMETVELSPDADIGEVRASVAGFAEVQSMTAELRRFLDLHHAGRWAAPGLEEIGVRAFFDGAYGDPVRIIAGLDQPRAPGKDAAQTGKGAKKVDANKVFTAFAEWFAHTPALAAGRRLLHWQPAFPGVWTEWESFDPRGGFDAVVGNPPYVRQEHIKALKPALKGLYGTFDGVADLYVYFIEQGLRLLRKGGRLSFVVTNKWIKAGYAEKLRRALGEDAWMEQVIDFGHAKGFFPDADVMPCVFVARRPDPAEEPPAEVAVAVIPRDSVDMTRLPEQVRAATFMVPRASLSRQGWVLEPPDVAALMAKIRRAGVPLKEYAGVSPAAWRSYGPERGVRHRRRQTRAADRGGCAERGDHQALSARPGHRPVEFGVGGAVDDLRPPRYRYRRLPSREGASGRVPARVGAKARWLEAITKRSRVARAEAGIVQVVRDSGQRCLFSRVLEAEDCISGNTIPPCIRSGSQRPLSEQQRILHYLGGPVAPGRAEQPGALVAQLAISRTCEGRGPYATGVPNGAAADRRVSKGGLRVAPCARLMRDTNRGKRSAPPPRRLVPPQPRYPHHSHRSPQSVSPRPGPVHRRDPQGARDQVRALERRDHPAHSRGMRAQRRSDGAPAGGGRAA